MALRPRMPSARDGRHDRHRDRVALLRQGGVDVGGHLLVQVEPWSEVKRGHLWWRRWSPMHEVPHIWVSIPGKSSDQYIPVDAIDDALRDWDAGCYDHYGELLEAVWLDEQEALQAWPLEQRTA